MGEVAKFCSMLAHDHPPLARAVLNKPLGRLDRWIDWRNEAGPCGCLVGTVALALGCTYERDVFGVDFVAQTLGLSWDDVQCVGACVADISARLGRNTPEGKNDPLAIHLIRQRIARELAVRESGMGLGEARLPHEPTEREVSAPALDALRVA